MKRTINFGEKLLACTIWMDCDKICKDISFNNLLWFWWL